MFEKEIQVKVDDLVTNKKGDLSGYVVRVLCGAVLCSAHLGGHQFFISFDDLVVVRSY